MTAQDVVGVADPMVDLFRIRRSFPRVNVEIVGSGYNVLIGVTAEGTALQRAGVVVAGMVELAPSARALRLKKRKEEPNSSTLRITVDQRCRYKDYVDRGPVCE